MAEPGSATLGYTDKTNKTKTEHWSVRTQPGGAHIISGLSRIVFRQATVTEYVADPIMITVVNDDDNKGVTVYSTSDLPVDVDVMLVGY